MHFGAICPSGPLLLSPYLRQIGRTNVDSAPPKSEADARSLVARMVDNGLFRDEQSLEQIVGYLARTDGR